MHLLAAQSWAETYCRREFDGEKLRTQYFDGNRNRSLIAQHYPIRSVSELAIDNGQSWGTDSIVSSSDYWIDSERGEVSLNTDVSFNNTQGPVFIKGEKNIRLKYYGGWIAEQTVVAAAVKGASHTIANDLLTYGQNFAIFLKTSGAFSAVSTGVVITGLDVNGAAYSESVIPNVNDTGATVAKPTISFATSPFSKITAVDSSALTGAGTIAVTAVSMPNDLRAAIMYLAIYLYKLDNQSRIGVNTRSTQGQSETLAPDEMPFAAKLILNLYKNINF